MAPKKTPAEVAAAKAEKEAAHSAKQEALAKKRAAAQDAKAKKQLATQAKREEQQAAKAAKATAKSLAGPNGNAKAKTLGSFAGSAKRTLSHENCVDAPAKKRKRQEWGNDDADELENDEPQSAELDKLSCLASSAVASNRAAFIAKETGLERKHVAGAVKLFDQGNTLPFIARYRKEQTGSMDEIALRRVERCLRRVEALEHRRKTIAVALLRLGQLDEVLTQLLASSTIEELDDLYEPYKAKRRTRAQTAREKGLGPLADLIDKAGGGKSWQDPIQVALGFCGPAGAASADEALQGARDILAERWSRKAAFKNDARDALKRGAGFMAKRKSPDVDKDRKYQNYWDFHVPLSKLWHHQFFAAQRGEKEKVLSISFTCKAGIEEEIVGKHAPWNGSEAWLNQLWTALTDGLKRLLRPTIEREWRRSLKEKAEDEAYDTYRRNLKAKLLMPPLFSKDRLPGCIVGLDPGYRNGCKLAVVDPTGGVMETGAIFPVPRQGGQPQQLQHEAEETLSSILTRLQPAAIAIGNGTASAETEEFVRRVLKSANSEIGYSIVDESGASIYSASPLAAVELPNMDVVLRGAVSIARRALDPLAELVKIDPQSIGVGLYQHDVDQKRLKVELHGVVEDCVNAVGVDINTASPALLQYVAGIGAKLSETLVTHRDASGAFNCRDELHKIKGLGSAAFEQCAGFLRITRGSEALDATAVHPESYSQARKLQKRFGSKCERLDEASAGVLESLAEELLIGMDTLKDIVTQLRGLEEDPRGGQAQQLMKHVCGKKRKSLVGEDLDGAIDAQEMGISVECLKPGMHLQGTVRNVVPFGTFVDVGVHHEGLLHFSKYPKPLPRPDWPTVNDRIVVTVEAPPEQRGKRWRISLSMRQGAAGG